MVGQVVTPITGTTMTPAGPVAGTLNGGTGMYNPGGVRISTAPTFGGGYGSAVNQQGGFTNFNGTGSMGLSPV